MRLPILTAVLAIATPSMPVPSGSASAAEPQAKPATASQATASRATVADPQSLRIGRQVVARPFGATLVDAVGVVGTVRTAAARYHLVRGTATGDCPARYVIVAESGQGIPRTSAPFGTCSSAATLRLRGSTPSVAMTDPVTGGLVRYDWRDGRMVTASADAVKLADAGPACISAGSVPADVEAETIATFQRDYPTDYRRGSRIRNADIAPAELRDMVAGLACLSTWPSGARTIPEAATELFASKRYGPAAFTELERLGRDGDVGTNLQAAARSFSAEMRYRVGRRSILRL